PRKGLGRVIVGSIVLHAGIIIGLVLLVGFHASARKPQKVIVTELVRLGKERPKDLLPRKEEPPPEPTHADPPPQSDQVHPAPQEKPPPPKDSAPSAKDRLSQLSKVNNALNRLKTEEEPEGKEDGSKYGTVAKALEGNKVASEVVACMKAHWTLPGQTLAQVAGKSADIAVNVERDGRLSTFEIMKSSGDQRFDAAVRNAAMACGRVSPPSAEIAEQMRKDGFEVHFTP
ncbi:MAG: TonB C-terminal domain-containing protein, partial [Clostridia bacterium]|nr:TonB C-terminal domain-containing protein [Deltaproteobacteria bacterium]